jgi:uroporphyrinogen decarboxylase
MDRLPGATLAGCIPLSPMTDRFLRACRREPVDATPVWFMRQAGRYMADYRALRERYSLLELCRTPELATQITLQPVDAIDVDAAIIFSDLLLPFEPMGLAFDFVKGEGPRVEQPLRSDADIDRLRLFEPREGLGYVLEAIALTRRALDGKVPLIGFAGAPFTLASYAIEGGPSRDFARTKALMYGHPEAWHRLCERLSTVVSAFVVAQVEAGAQAIQIFDSWVGALSAEDYREFARPHTAAVFAALQGSGVPTIHFGTGTSTILTDLASAGGDVIGVDWRLPLDVAWQQLGDGYAVQGNLDPTLLLGPRHRLLRAAGDVLDRAAGRPGHIFNLGHGILPATPLEHVQALARFVHGYRAS